MRSKYARPSSGHFVSFTKDISTLGASLVLPKEINTGEVLAIGLEIPTSFIPLLIYARVVWVKDMILWGDSIYSFTEVGVRFLSISAPDMRKLTEYINTKEEACART